MSTFEIIKGAQEQTNSTVLNENLSMVEHQQIQKKCVRTVGNLLNGNPRSSVTTAATISSTKVACTSYTSLGKVDSKSVVSSLCMSVERKESSLHYSSEARKVSPCVLTAGQNTIIHLDNYAQFMAQRASTTRSEILPKEQEKTVSCSSATTTTTSGGKEIAIGVIDVDLKVVLGGVSSYCTRQQTINMHKQKVPAKAKIRKTSLRTELPKATENSKDIVDLKKVKTNLSMAVKPTAKKPKINRRRRTSNKQSVNPKNSGRCDKNETIKEENSNLTDIPKHFSRLTQTEREWKIMKPCCSLLQNKKCATEITCPYLHSDFPCKYYYLSLPCPQGHKCQFMHNGPLAPRLLEALRSHILDLLSSKPSCVETYFVQQMHQIDSIYQRLMNFKKIEREESQVIEVLDDCDEDPILISDEGSNECNENASVKTIPDAQVLDTSDEKLDIVYESFKETNALLAQIDGKLKNLKSTSNLTSNEKLVELQKIYEILKEKEKLLPIYENINNCTEIRTVDNDLLLTAKESKYIVSNKLSDEKNLVSVHPDIVNEIETIESEENLITITDNECGTETISKENLSQCNKDIEDTTGENRPEESTEIEIETIESEENLITITDNEGGTETISKENLSQCDKDIEDTTGENRPEESKEIVSSLHEIEEKNLEDKTEIFENSCHSTDLNIEKEIMAVDSKNYRETQIISLNDTREKVINLSKNEATEAEKIDNATNENITSPKHLDFQEFDGSSKKSRIYLRSCTQQNLDGSLNSLNSKETKEAAKVKRRRLRLPKHNAQSLENAVTECQLKADSINKQIQSEENNSDKNTEAPLTQNVILSKRFLKKAKTNLQKNIEGTNLNNTNNKDLDKTIEHNMFVLHNDVSTIENIDVPLLTQTSDDNVQSLNILQECLIIAGDSDNNSKVNYLEDSLKTQPESNKVMPSARELKENQNLKRRISSEHASSSTTTAMATSSFSFNFKQKFNLRNPHIVLTKLKSSDLEQMDRNKMIADSTTYYVNSPNVTSTLLSDDKTPQKRRSCSPEYDLDSTLKESKFLKIDSDKNIWNPEQKNDDIDDFHADVEKLHVADATNSSIAENERQQGLKPSLAHATAIETLQSGGPQYVVQQHENESDLRQQQIENVSNKSDLQLQSQQQGNRNPQQQMEVGTEIITSSFIAENIEHEQREEETKSSKEIEKQIAKTCNPYGNVEEYADGQEKSHSLQHSTEGEEEPSNNSKEKYSNEPIKPSVLRQEDEEQVEYEKYASLYNKLTAHTSKCQINFENSSVNITPIASPTYGNDAIASPSPTKKRSDFHMTSEIDACLTYPPIPYILYEIDLEKIDFNRPQYIDKLKKTFSLDPRIFRSSVKKQTMIFHKPTAQILNAVEPSTSMVVPYDPRKRSSAGALTDVESPLPTNQTALSSYSAHSMTPSATALPLSLDYNTPQIVYPQVQQQQTPNMFLYGCLQRSPWYQSLMSTMKIQINQSISQLVRALNNFYRERLLNPLIVFDVFKIDCAGEILEIMRNLDIFIDSNGVINEQRQVSSFAGRSCCNNTPVNATYSFIQQVLTPNAHRTSLTTTSSTYNASGSGTMGSLNMAEPFVSCYIKPPESLQKQHLNGMTNSPCTDDNNQSCLCKKEETYNNNGRNSHQNDRHYNQFKNNNNSNEHKGNNNNNNYQHRSYQRPFNNNPRFSKTSEFQNRSSSSPPNSPKGSNNYDNSNSHKGGGYGAGRGRGGRFNNNNNKKRFNNYNNNNSGFSWPSSNSSESDKCFNDKSSYNSSNSPIRPSSPSTSYQQRNESPIGNSITSAPITAPKPSTNDDEEECWD